MTSMLLRIPVEIELIHQGRTVKASGIADTGAPGILSIERSVVAPLGLSLSDQYTTGGYVKGATIPAWRSKVDALTVVGNPACSMKDVPIEVVEGSETGEGIESFLLGDDFFRMLNARIDYTEGGARIICRPHHVSWAPLVVGGLILAVGVTAAYITRNQIE